VLSLLDWESSLFSSKDSTTILKEVDAKIGHPAFTNPASPPSIVVYSAVYALGASPKYLGYLGHPALLNFVVRVSETNTQLRRKWTPWPELPPILQHEAHENSSQESLQANSRERKCSLSLLIFLPQPSNPWPEKHSHYLSSPICQ
jgi:hypothetical protein